MRVAIDPGDLHVGWAELQGLCCTFAGEYNPDTACLALETMIEKWEKPIEEVIIEEYRLYPWKLQEQGFRQMLTSQMIGALLWICKRGGVPVVMQPAMIQKPTAARMKAQGVQLTSRGCGPHAKSAELHGLYRVWTLKETEEAGVAWDAPVDKNVEEEWHG